MTYTIQELADLAGVTTRTLRYYDQLGLLIAARPDPNGYRSYNHADLLKLQQILFYRELGLPLKEIREMITQPEFDLVSALESHREELQHKRDRMGKLITTIDRTIATLQGVGTMTDQEMFQGFDESKYKAEARDRWGSTPQYAESQRRWTGYSDEQKEAIKTEGSRLIARMVGTDPSVSPDDPEIQAAVGEYLAYLNQYFYSCDASFLRGLADVWVQDPRFAAVYESIREGGAEFIRQAVHVYAAHHG